MTFKEQVSTQAFVEDLLYSVAALSVLFVVIGLTLLDMGLARRKNVLDTAVQKLVAALVAGLGTFFVGYAIWNWQFYQAFGRSLADALGDWWLGGRGMTTPSQSLNPKEIFAADPQQLFVVFFVTFSMATLALIHSSVIERIKPFPLYVMAAVIGLFLSPFAGYLGWGSAGWLTNKGVHDLEGVFPLYIFAGTWALVLNWRLGPRFGSFSPHPSGARPAPHNLSLAVPGVLLILFALPFIALGSGYIVPGEGFVGISMTTSGWGLIVMNTTMALCGGTLSGVLLAYILRDWVWTAFGPLAGVVINATFLDVSKPWIVFLVSLCGAPLAYGVRRAAFRFGIDDPKVVPLALGPGLVGAIAVGFIHWHTKTGGYFGGQGSFAFQHAEITPWWQIIGVLAIVGLSGISALLLCLFFERWGGLRAEESVEVTGFDVSYWKESNFQEESAVQRERSSVAYT